MKGKLLPTILFSLLVAACGGGQQPSQVDVEKEAKETMDRIRKGEKITETASGLDPCEILKSGVVADEFGVDAAAIRYHAGSTRHPVCLSSWRKPNADEIEAATPQLMMDYMKRKAAAQQKKEPFDEKMPIPRPEAEANLTIYGESYDGPAAAAAGLEGIVATMSKGVTATVGGKDYTSQVTYEGWIDGVGDKAAWAPKLSQLSVAAKGVIFHVSVRAFDDPAENQSKAIALAKRIIPRL